jgi:hypothetical protein
MMMEAVGTASFQGPTDIQNFVDEKVGTLSSGEEDITWGPHRVTTMQIGPRPYRFRSKQ